MVECTNYVRSKYTRLVGFRDDSQRAEAGSRTGSRVQDSRKSEYNAVVVELQNSELGMKSGMCKANVRIDCLINVHLVFGGAASRSGFIGDTVASFAGSGPDVDLADDLGHGLDDLLADLALRGIVVDTLPQGGNADLNLNFDET